MADSLFDLELPDDGDRVSLIGAPAEEPASSRASMPRARSARSASRAPLAVRMRPRTIDEVLGQEHLLTPARPARAGRGERRPGWPVLGDSVRPLRVRVRPPWRT